MTIWAYVRHGNLTVRVAADDTGTPNPDAPHTRGRYTRAARPPHPGIPTTFDGLELELVIDPHPNVDTALNAVPFGECVIFDDAGGGHVWVGGVPMDDLDGIIMDGTPFERPVLRDE